MNLLEIQIMGPLTTQSETWEGNPVQVPIWCCCVPKVDNHCYGSKMQIPDQ